jgi:enoyl-CoA hydratase/carnithine racemase
MPTLILCGGHVSAPGIDASLLERGGVSLAVEGERATVTLNRPESLNAQRPSTWDALAAIGAGLDPAVRVVVLRGAGRAFSAGLDRGMLSPGGIAGEAGFQEITAGSDAEGAAVIENMQRGFTWLADPARVTIAAVHGHAIGAGFQLALACDIRIATEDVRFRMAEPSLGLVPDLTGTLHLVRAVGYSRAVEIVLTARQVGAEEALRIGLVNTVVPGDQLDVAVDTLVAGLLAVPAGAAAESLALLARAADPTTLDEQRAAERAAQVRRFRELHKLLAAMRGS